MFQNCLLKIQKGCISYFSCHVIKKNATKQPREESVYFGPPVKFIICHNREAPGTWSPCLKMAGCIIAKVEKKG